MTRGTLSDPGLRGWRVEYVAPAGPADGKRSSIFGLRSRLEDHALDPAPVHHDVGVLQAEVADAYSLPRCRPSHPIPEARVGTCLRARQTLLPVAHWGFVLDSRPLSSECCGRSPRTRFSSRFGGVIGPATEAGINWKPAKPADGAVAHAPSRLAARALLP